MAISKGSIVMQIRLALLAARHWKQILIAICALFTVLFMSLFGAMEEQQQYQYAGGGAQVSPAVLAFEPTVATYAKQYGVESYVPILLAYMMQESGGMSPDVMQSSESLGLPPNSITDPVLSIQVGVRYFSGLIQQSHGDVNLALQSYNFGGGFISYALARGGYSKQVAVEFSQMMAAQLGWSSYGDPDYVDHVMRYVASATPASQPTVSNGNEEPWFQNVMKVALQYKGMPYYWGGNTPVPGFDCSGLWQFSFKQIGITLPRTAQDQYNATQRVTKDQLKPGDFIFFSGTYNGPFITHVGLYVGNGYMYDSDDSGIGYHELGTYWQSHIAGYGRLN